MEMCINRKSALQRKKKVKGEDEMGWPGRETERGPEGTREALGIGTLAPVRNNSLETAG